MPNRAASLSKVRGVAGIEAGKDLLDSLLDFGSAQKIPVSFGRDGKAIGYFNSPRHQLPNHLSQGCILAAHERDVIDPDLFEPPNISSSLGVGCHVFLPLRPEFLQLLRH